MGGHGGLNILPQKSWHVYNQDNREKVARDEAKYEAEQKVLREKNRKAESEFRHAALLARVRGAPLDAATQSGELPPPPAEEAAAVVAQPALEPPVKHDIMAAKRAVQQPDGHFNFWRAEELRESNADTKADEAAERRKRGNPETQTSDARFDERFKFAHAMQGKGNTPWYAAAGTRLPAEDAANALDGGKLLAAATRADADGNVALLVRGHKKHKHKHKDTQKDRGSRKKHKGSDKEAALKAGAKQLKASIAAMRAEREAREAAERAREKQLLLRSFLA